MRNLLLSILLAMPIAALAAPMTNNDVIKMVKAGLGEATVIQSINAAEPAFDTSPDGLIKLKQGGVSDKVIQLIQSRKPGAKTPASAGATCNDCGTITSVREVDKPGKASGAGAVAGAVAGGLLGRELGGNHRTVGTVVGAAGGAVAGHMIEKKAREGKTWEIGVKFDDGKERKIHQDAHPSWKKGDRVKRVDGKLTPL
jgi:outer membrane lipoprotein SlyB